MKFKLSKIEVNYKLYRKPGKLYQFLKTRILFLQICLYDVRVDIYVSGSIAESGSWEGNMGKFLHHLE